MKTKTEAELREELAKNISEYNKLVESDMYDKKTNKKIGDLFASIRLLTWIINVSCAQCK